MDTRFPYQVPHHYLHNPIKVVYECEPTSSGGTQQTGTERCSSSSGSTPSRVLLPHIHYSQENRGTTNHQLEGAKSLHTPCPFQDGEHLTTTGYPPPQRLVGEDRPEGGLLFSTPGHRTSSGSGERSSLQIHMPLLWAVQCPQDIHQALEASSGISSSKGSSSSHIHRRYSNNGRYEREGSHTSHSHSRYPGILGILHQLQKIDSLTNSTDQISRFSGQLCDHNHIITSGEDPEGDQRSPVITTMPNNHSTPTSEDGRNTEFLYSGSNTSSITLLPLTNRQE